MCRNVTLGLLLALLVAPGFAQEKPERQRISRPGRTPTEETEQTAGQRRAGKGSIASIFERTRDALELDDAQSEQFDALVAAARKKIAAGRSAEKQGGEREESVSAVIDEFYDSVSKILRPDQQTKLDRLRSASKLETQGRRPDAKGLVKRLRQQLGLSDEQAAQWDAMYAEVEGRRGGGGAVLDDETTELINQLREAIASNDTAKIEELRGKFKEKQDGQGSSDAAIHDFLDRVSEILTPTQQKQLAAARDKFAENAEAAAGEIDARSLLALTRRIDLTPEQKAQVREIERSWRERSRELRRDRAATVALDDEVKAQVRDVLTPEQSAELDELIAREGGRGSRPARPSRTPKERE